MSDYLGRGMRTRPPPPATIMTVNRCLPENRFVASGQEGSPGEEKSIREGVLASTGLPVLGVLACVCALEALH